MNRRGFLGLLGGAAVAPLLPPVLSRPGARLVVSVDPALTTGVAVATYGDISQRTASYAMVQMLRLAEPKLIMTKFAQVPKAGNDTATTRFRRPVPFQ